MKKLTLSILFVLFLFPTMSHAQDWRCVRDTVKAFFVDNANIVNPHFSNTMWAVSIDSVILDQGYTYYYGYPKFRLVSRSEHWSPNGYRWNDYCADAFGSSWIGTAMSAGESGTYFFNSAGDAVRICTDRQLNQPWNCSSITDTSYLEGVINFMGVENVLGVSDSVKYISFQAKRYITGELLPHPLNAKTFKISKHFGMLTLFDFYQFPVYDSLTNPVHYLAGTASPGYVIGMQNLTKKEIYSFAPGDVFHTFKRGWGPDNGGSGASETKIVKTILDSIWNSNKDIVTYKIRRHKNYWNGWFDYGHEYSIDTVIESYAINSSDACSGINNYPEESILCYGADEVLNSANCYLQKRTYDYHSRWVKIKENDYKPSSICADTLMGLSTTSLECHFLKYYYIEGCGGLYYEDTYDADHSHHYTEYYEPVYFKKGTETWGNPYNTTNWHYPTSIVENEKVKLNIYPNPSGDVATIEIPGSENEKFSIEIADLTGVKIDELNFEANKFTFPVSNYSKGMYILKLYKDERLVGEQKLIKN